MVALILVLALLGGCSEQSTATAVTNTTGGLPLSTVANTTNGTATTKPTAPVSGTPVASTEALDQLKTVLQQQAASNSYRVTVTQKLTLKSGGGISNITAEGNGIFARPNLNLKLELKTSGQSQQLEVLSLDGESWQRLSSLAIWQKLPGKYSPDLPVTLLEKASGWQGSREKLNGVDTLKLTVTLDPAILLKEPSLAGPDWLGLLSATSVSAGAPGQGGFAKINFWLDNGRLIRRQTLLQTGQGDNLFDFETDYRYQDLNLPGLTVMPPPNFPRP